MPVNATRTIFPFLKHEPKPGSFWFHHLTMGSHTTHYVHADGDETQCIGEINRVARRRFRWCRYDKPVKIDTTRRNRPKFAESHTVGSISSAIWALRTSHENANG